MNFRTEISCSPLFSIGYQDPVLSLGSCFAEMTAQKLQERRFQVLSNPFGTLYNVDSLCFILDAGTSAGDQAFDPQHYIEREGVWFSLDGHSSVWGESPAALQARLAETLARTRDFLSKAKVLFLTLGTARVHRYKASGRIVANCQKLPASHFSVEMQSPDEVLAKLAHSVNRLRSVNPDLKIILSLSPVRHLKDALPENAVSKSILRYALWRAEKEMDNTVYFPAYEILLDDLRDYRFYGPDLVHPSPQAEEYIWEKFCDAFFEENTKVIMKEWMSLKRAMAHRPFRKDTSAHLHFLKKTLEGLEKFHDMFDCEQERNDLAQRIAEIRISD